MRKKKRNEKPLLYIYQKNIETPKLVMQDKYYSRIPEEKINLTINEENKLDEIHQHEESTNLPNPLEDLESLNEPIVNHFIMKEKIESVVIKKKKETDQTISIEKDKDNVETMMKEENLLTKEMKEKKKNRPHFDTLSLEHKIKQLQRTPASVAKIQYTFITEGKKHTGYFESLNGDELTIIPSKENQAIQIAKENIIDIILFGI